MSADDPQPPPPAKPDPTIHRMAGAALFVSIYGVLALAFLGVAFYFAILQKQPITSPRVFVALIGAIYMGFRAWMMFNKHKGGPVQGRAPGGDGDAR